MSTVKNQRINLRASQRQESILRQAASASDTSVSDFILGSAVDRAERVLADRRWFNAAPERYDEFVQLLEQPIETTKLTQLLSREPVFESPFEMDDE